MHLRFCLFVYCADFRHGKRGVCTAPMGDGAVSTE